MSTAEDVDKLKLFWDHFFKAETGTYEKSAWLDLFLAEFLIRVRDGANPVELIHFCPISGVVSLVGCELLCGIHRVTSAINTHYTVPVPSLDLPQSSVKTVEPEEPKQQPTGLFSRANAQSSTEILKKYLLSGVAWRCLTLLKILGVEGLSCCRQLSSVLIWLCGELSATDSGLTDEQETRNPYVPLSEGTEDIHKLFSKRIWCRQKLIGSPKITVPAPERTAVTRSKRIPNKTESPDRARKMEHDSDETGESVHSGSSLQLLNRSLSIKVSPGDDFEYFESPARSDLHVSIPNQRKKPRADEHATDAHRAVLAATLTGTEFAHLAAELLRALCRAHCSLAGAEAAQVSLQCLHYALRGVCALQFGSHAAPALKLALTELAVVALDRVLVQPDLCTKLIGGGVLPTLLRILEDVVRKAGGPLAEDNSRLPSFVFGVAYSVFAFYHCLLMQCRSVERLRDFADQFRLYGECLQGRALASCVELLLRTGAAGTAASRRLACGAGRLVGGMRRARGAVLHGAACGRIRHRACRRRVVRGLHHHHDALGAARGPPGTPTCAVAAGVEALAGLLELPALAARRGLARSVLRALLACGACCCVDAVRLAARLTRLARLQPAAAAASLRVLERLAYGELCAGGRAVRAPDTLPCAVCERGARNPSLVSAYAPLLAEDAPAGVVAATLAHLARVSSRCSRTVRRELLLGLLLPALEGRRSAGGAGGAGACLGALAPLLEGAGAAERFAAGGGLAAASVLAREPESARSACHVLEVCAAAEAARGGRGEAARALIRAADEAAISCERVLRLRLGDAAFEAACDTSTYAQPCQPQAEVESVSDVAAALRHAAAAWSALGSLSLLGRGARCAASGCLGRARRLLGPALHSLRVPLHAHHVKLTVRLLDALITVHVAYDDGSTNSKQVCCGIISEAVESGVFDSEESIEATRLFCDALVRVSMKAVSVVDCMPAPAPVAKMPVACRSRSSSPSSSSDGSATETGDSERSDDEPMPDDGYEADVEVGRFEQHTPIKTRNVSIGSNEGESLFDEEEVHPVYKSGGVVVHPELCVIVIDILSKVIQKAVDAAQNDSPSVTSWAALGGAICARAASSSGPILTPLLTAATPLLTVTHSGLTELQRSVLELFEVLASQSISRAQVVAFLRLLQTPSPRPLLLATLRRLAVAGSAHAPHCLLTFPAVTNSELNDTAHTNGQSHPAEHIAKTYREQHLQAGVSSCWARAAVRCGVEGANWAPWLQGFALVLWLQRDGPAPTPKNDYDSSEDEDWQEPYESEKTRRRSPAKKETDVAQPGELSHLLSIGHEALIFEMWMDTGTGSLTVRLSRPSPQSNKTVSEAVIAECVPAGRCLSVAAQLTERVYKRKAYIQVTVYVNGCEVETLSLPIQGILVRKVTPVNLLLGDAVSSPVSRAWHLASVCVYRSPVLNTYAALHRAALGPDASPLGPTLVDNLIPNYAVLLTPELLESNIDWEQVWDTSSSPARQLQDKILLSYSAHSPNVFNLYHQSTPNVFGVRGAGGTGGVGGAEAGSAVWVTSPRPTVRRSLAAAVHALGGPDLLLCMIAAVLEQNGSDAEVAAALGVLLRLCRNDSRLHAAFYCRPVPLLAVALYNIDVLHMIILEACNTEVLSLSSAGVATVHARTNAAILHPELLLFNFDMHTKECVWEEEDTLIRRRGTLWALAVRVTSILVHERNPHRAFNLQQLHRASYLQHLMLTVKERFLISEGTLVDEEASDLMDLTRSLLGTPPSPALVTDLLHLVLLLHPASDTHVSHSRRTMCLLATDEQPGDGSVLLALSRRQRRTARQKTKENLEDFTAGAMSSSTTSDSMVNENSLNNLKEIAQSQDTVDSAKEIKSLINMQIKERSKHNISSTSISENSDATLEESSETGGESLKGEKEKGDTLSMCESEMDNALSDYIVVDVDEVNRVRDDIKIFNDELYDESEVKGNASGAGVEIASEGFTKLLHEAVKLMPQNQVPTTINLDIMLVLANHKSSVVRANVVRALTACHMKGHHDLTKSHRIAHLANQVSTYECSEELGEACVSLITGYDVTLQEHLREEIWHNIPEAMMSLSVPLMAIIPRAIHDPELAVMLLKIAHYVVDKCTLKMISEIAAVECCVRLVRFLGEQIITESARDSILRTTCDVLAAVANKALNSQHSLQTAIDIHHLLSYIERSAYDSLPVRTCARDAQSTLFALELAHAARPNDSKFDARANHTNYFTTVLSSAVSLTDLTNRWEAASNCGGVASRAVTFLSTRPDEDGPLSIYEAQLIDLLINNLIEAWRAETSARKPRGGAAGTLLADLCRLVMGSDAARSLVPRLLRALYSAHHPPPPPAHPHQLHQLQVFVSAALSRAHLSGSLELAVCDWARGWARSLGAVREARPPAPAQLGAVAAQLRLAAATHALRDQDKQIPAWCKVVFRREAQYSQVSQSAATSTWRAVGVQDGQRKEFLQKLRDARSIAARAADRLMALPARFTHEAGVWHQSAGYPQSWALDATEGPGRVRVRLRRAHLRLHTRFLLPEHQHKAESWRSPGALERGMSMLVGVGAPTGGAGRGIGARLAGGERVTYMARVRRVTVASDTPQELLLTHRAIHLIPEETPEEDSIPEPEPEPGTRAARKKYAPTFEPTPPLTCPLHVIKVVATRRWCLREVAVELMVNTGRAHLIAFNERQERDDFLRALADLKVPLRSEAETLSEAQSLWRAGSISNWEYLMRLNDLGGRSYNDLMQYPVMPFVLADYSSRILDLKEPKVFRDLAKPMAVQNKNREQHYINTFNDLAAAAAAGNGGAAGAGGAHHYASLYSNSGAVLHYLVRLPPFTQLFLNYQDNNFDMPDRTFHSLATTWRLITNDSPTDVKELIPELFYMPQLFYNNEGLALGVRQCGEAVDAVALPAWAADARLFTLVHRQALEAEHVSDRLPLWIDLVFGYKQTGQAAKDAINVFPACTYYGFDPWSLSDDVERTAAEAMVRTYGQAPRALFNKPHPMRTPTHNAQPEPESPPVWGGVEGGCWGRYCGAGGRVPSVVSRRRLPVTAVALQPLRARRAVAALPPRAVLSTDTANDATSTNGANTGGMGLALVWWGTADRSLRVRRRAPNPELLLHVTHPADHEITCAWSSSVWTGGTIFLGEVSGRVLVIRTDDPSGGSSSDPSYRPRSRALLAHTAPIVDVHVCPAMAVIVTASEDGVIIVWDLNDLTYIRTLPNRDMLPTTHVTVSETLCDVASVHDLNKEPGQPMSDKDGDSDSYEKDKENYSSLIRVHTVNADYVGSVKVAEVVTAVVYSHAPEGVSVNCVVAGLSSGAIRMYSSWDLRPVTYIPPASSGPLLSICYSRCSEVLFGCYPEGLVVAWENCTSGKPAPLKILTSHSLT